MYPRGKRQQETSPGPHYSVVYEYVCVGGWGQGERDKKGGFKQKMQKNK